MEEVKKVLFTEESEDGINERGGECSQAGEESLQKRGKRAGMEEVANVPRQEKNLCKGEEGVDKRSRE